MLRSSLYCAGQVNLIKWGFLWPKHDFVLQYWGIWRTTGKGFVTQDGTPMVVLKSLDFQTRYHGLTDRVMLILTTLLFSLLNCLQLTQHISYSYSSCGHSTLCRPFCKNL